MDATQIVRPRSFRHSFPCASPCRLIKDNAGGSNSGVRAQAPAPSVGQQRSPHRDHLHDRVSVVLDARCRKQSALLRLDWRKKRIRTCVLTI